MAKTQHITRHVDDLRFGRWHGVIKTHAFKGELTPDEYQFIVKCALGRRLNTPDDFAQDGTPLYYVNADAAKRLNRELTRLCCDYTETENTPCNAGRTALLNFVANTGGLTGVQYFAVGTGTGTPASGDTALYSEQFRKAPSSTLVSGSNITVSCLFGTGEGNYNITEAGLFGDGATSTSGSGQLFAHAQYFYNKTSSVTLTNQYTITFN